MKSIYVILCIFIFSCDYNKDNTILLDNATFEDKKLRNVKDSVSKEIRLDSAFIGEPKVSDISFIHSLYESKDITFKMFDSIFILKNEFFSRLPAKGLSKKMSINKNLSLELKQIHNDSIDFNSNIQLMLFTRINGLISDSILFYKFRYDPSFPDEQRFETLINIKSDLVIWYLDTFTNHSEFAIGIRIWNKYKINVKTGKIELLLENMVYDTP